MNTADLVGDGDLASDPVSAVAWLSTMLRQVDGAPWELSPEDPIADIQRIERLREYLEGHGYSVPPTREAFVDPLGCMQDWHAILSAIVTVQ